jgi:hypothetical protein
MMMIITNHKRWQQDNCINPANNTWMEYQLLYDARKAALYSLSEDTIRRFIVGRRNSFIHLHSTVDINMKTTVRQSFNNKRHEILIYLQKEEKTRKQQIYSWYTVTAWWGRTLKLIMKLMKLMKLNHNKNKDNTIKMINNQCCCFKY